MSSLQGIHPVLWPVQLAGAVVVFGVFLLVIGAAYAAVAVYDADIPTNRALV